MHSDNGAQAYELQMFWLYLVKDLIMLKNEDPVAAINHANDVIEAFAKTFPPAGN